MKSPPYYRYQEHEQWVVENSPPLDHLGKLFQGTRKRLAAKVAKCYISAILLR